MAWRFVQNQTTKTVKRSVRNYRNERQKDPSISVTENCPNWLGYATTPGDGTPIVYPSRDHRPWGTSQYNANTP